MADVGKLKAKFLHAHANLPEPEKTQVVVIMEDVSYSWDKVYSEVSDDTKLGNRLLVRLHELGIL